MGSRRPSSAVVPLAGLGRPVEHSYAVLFGYGHRPTRLDVSCPSVDLRPVQACMAGMKDLAKL